MAIDKLSDVLKQEAEGIMFPFRNKVKPVSDTTQEAYNSTTDGIMSITGKKYIGPDSVIQYGDSYQRQLKQIEKGMLPQFDQQQFPDVGEGIVEDRGFPKAQPVDTTPVQPDEPKFDPCPPGFKLIDGVCQPIEQDRGDRDDPIKIDPRRNMGDTAQGLDIATKALQKEGISSSTKGDISIDINNSIPWLKFVPIVGNAIDAYQKNIADEKLKKLAEADGITITTNPDGTQKLNISDAVGKRSYGQLQTKESLAGNMASTQKLNAAGTAIEKAPNGQNMIVGPLTLDYFGKGNLFQPTTRTPAETDALNAEEKNKLLAELDAALGLDSTATTPEPVTVDPESTAADATDTESTGGGLMSGTTSEPGDTFGEITNIDLKDSKTGEVVSTVNKRFTDNITTGHFRLSNTLATITNLQNRVNSNPRDTQAPRLLETAKDVAEEEFNNSIKEDNDGGNNSLSKSQKDYLDSDNRRALPGETKSANGKDLDSRRDFVPGRENEGYGFRSTSGNYNKSTNTFDQRFK
jgi:hypothetical protein